MLSLRMPEKIIILDFGSQYTQLIARRVRELDVYCEIHPYNHLPEFDQDVKGVILSGSPCSVRDQDAPQIDLTPISDNYPLLGVCYGAQYLSQQAGGLVLPSSSLYYGRANFLFIIVVVLLLLVLSNCSHVCLFLIFSLFFSFLLFFFL